MAEQIRIIGGKQLNGEVFISGAKNAVLKLMAAALLVKGTSKIYNVPKNIIEEYNTIDSLSIGDKVLIPKCDE